MAEKILVKSMPLLANGDRLSRAEFERRYAAMPNDKKVELIEGIVYMASPLRFESHAEPHGNLIGWLGVYQVATPGVRLGIEPTLRLDLDNEPQPDGVLLLDEKVGGQSRISDDDYIEGAPEFVAEIAASSVGYDLYDKKRAYRRNGVKEYFVWQVYEQQLDWFRLTNDEYVCLSPDGGILRSEVLPGLWLAVDAWVGGDMGRVLAVLQEGINSLEHTEFVRELSKKNVDG
ncbi:MAG: Uma2 family endonuclease [Gomphosphaeria aponina SAG 52.96 = DSM 107014]|uniref:Uma2 family endonuclease n=1 Tax=Gomphosphaeria aponina SAG 52.96 = DSM 107014 TaxID=1521640 RepID=A0A941JUM7_9CHRO|nr:Uma2 family endonuclease [Gomphosphaeria aponina SAG 52.96 = DSM 107014]